MDSKATSNETAFNDTSFDDFSFNERCYALLKRIPEGKVTTYKEMAHALNSKAWRAVGSAMAKNKNLIDVPCHRVVRSNGTVGEYALGSAKKAELLIAEGLTVTNGRVKNLAEVFHQFSA
jgi:methylated-DNA-[protein]-cysteine S-methyltransferase